MSQQGRMQQAIQHYRQSLLNNEAEAERALNAAHLHTLSIIQPQLDKLYVEITAKLNAGEAIPPSWIYERLRLEHLTLLIKKQVDQFGALSLQQTRMLQHQGAQLGQQSALAQLDATVPPGISWSFGLPDPKAIADLVGATQAGSPLADLFGGFGDEAADKVGKALVTGLSLGNNPRQVARDVQQALGISRNRALVISRQELNRAYRSANLQTFQANKDVVGQWRWTAAKQARTCFPKGTLVQTSRGSVPIEQVRRGDEVLTHKGHYRRVYDTLQRPYSREMVTVVSGDRSVVATSNHPFLIEREGKLNWIEAGNIRLTDHVICKSDSGSQIVNHDLGNITIERHIRDTDNAISSALQECGFSSVRLLDSYGAMPVDTIHLKSSVRVRQEEINGISPALYNMLLQIVDSQPFQAEPYIPFRYSLSSMFAVALKRAEASSNSLRGCCSELLSAIRAGIDCRRPTAFLRTMLYIRAFLIKDFAATFAGNIGYLEHFTGLRAIDLSLLARNHCKTLVTCRTGLRNMLVHFIETSAFLRTVFSISQIGITKYFSASLAGIFNGRHGRSTCASMWLSLLVDGIAINRTKTPISFALPSDRNDELFATDLTGQFNLSHSVLRYPRFTTFRTAIGMFLPFNIADIYPGVFPANGTKTLDIPPVSFDIKFFHASIISQLDIHVHRNTTVYNIEVEGDHSYVANGFVVHNCAACLAMDGTLHDLSEEFGSHVQCRCTPTPITKDWSDILGPLGIDTSNIPDSRPQMQSGSDWLDAQPESTQREVLGNKYDGWANGDFTLQDTVKHTYDADWGHSIGEKSLEALVK